MLRGCNQNTLKNLFNENKTIYSLNDRTIQNKRGRPKGGIAWIIDKSLKDITTIRYITSRITTCHIKIKHPISLIGVYMPTMGSDENYEDELDKLDGLIHNLDTQDNKTMIFGDMNADLWRSHRTDNNPNARNYKNDKLFTKLVNDDNSILINLGQLQTQKAPNTYLDIQGYQSTIDHLLINNNTLWNLNQIYVNIHLTEEEKDMMSRYSQINWRTENLETWDINNQSDHRPIMIEIELDDTQEIRELSTNTGKINWLNSKHVDQYNILVNEKLKHFDPEHEARKILTLTDKTERKIRAEELLLKTHDMIAKAKEKVEEKINRNLCNKHTKSREWWTPELTRMRDKIKSLRHEKITRKRSIWLINQDLAKARREYKKKIIQSKRKVQSKATSLINKMHKNDKISFWKEIKKRKRSLVEPEIEIDELVKLYGDLLTRSNITSIQDETDLSDYDKTILQEPSKVEVSSEDIHLIIKNLKNNKATGIMNITNEMYKKLNGDWLAKTISIIFEIIKHKTDNSIRPHSKHL
jgi:hypothetical protein